MSAHADPGIGPNAIIQVGAALEARHGPGVADALFQASGLGAYRTRPPAALVPESEVIALHRELRRSLPVAELREVARAAGVATGDYLIAHRIPLMAQRVLRAMPRRIAARALLLAVARHAWTFAGSGELRIETGRRLGVTLIDCPLCRGVRASEPACDYYAAVFERLFAVLVADRSRVLETECRAEGADRCRFEILIN